MDAIPGELIPLLILSQMIIKFCGVCSCIPQDTVQSLIDGQDLGTSPSESLAIL